MKIGELFEGLSGVLYHLARLDGVGSIINSDMLKSSTGGISFSRSITGQYGPTYRLLGVMFIVDGILLGRKYKGSPVGTEGIEINDYSGRENKQLEDRVFSKSIDNFNRYIKDVYIVIPLEYLSYGEDEFEVSYMEQLEFLPKLVPLIEKRFGKAKFILSERDLYSKKSYDTKSALSKIGKFISSKYDKSVLENIDGDLLKYLGIDIEEGHSYELIYNLVVDCDEECASEEEEMADSKLSHLDSWDWGLSRIDVGTSRDTLMQMLHTGKHDLVSIIKNATDTYGSRVYLNQVYSVELSKDIIFTDEEGKEKYIKVPNGITYKWYNDRLLGKK